MRILIIEDDEKTAALLENRLFEEHIQSEKVSTPEEALTKTLEGEWDAYLMDLRIMNGNGINLIREFRKVGDYTPAVVLTSMKREDVSLSELDGVYFFVEKGTGRGVEAAVEAVKVIPKLNAPELSDMLDSTIRGLQELAAKNGNGSTL